MRKKEVALIYNYIYNNRQRLEEELRELQQNIRYRRIDVVDCVELTCAIERLNTFVQTSRDIIALLNIADREESENE